MQVNLIHDPPQFIQHMVKEKKIRKYELGARIRRNEFCNLIEILSDLKIFFIFKLLDYEGIIEHQK